MFVKHNTVRETLGLAGRDQVFQDKIASVQADACRE